MDFSGETSSFSDSFSPKKRPQEPFGSAARKIEAESLNFNEQRMEILGVIPIDIPNTIHGCKKLNINGRKATGTPNSYLKTQS